MLLGLLGISGCADTGDRPELGEVEGVVTLDSKPLAGALVTFKPDLGKPSFAKTDENGNYRIAYLRDISGAKVGTHRIKITTATEENPEETVPSRYNDESELVREVSPGNNQLDFHLESGT